MVTEAIGIGLFVGFAFGELFGMAPGGMVVPGYVALFFDNPVALASIIGTSILTYLFVQVLGRYFIVFGRRRFVLCILVGFLFNQAAYYLLRSYGLPDDVVLYSFGFIVPGLIANGMETQGPVATLGYLAIASVVVKLILIVITGGA
jgi:gamma-polyglutamate biosynthesis protein CapC